MAEISAKELASMAGVDAKRMRSFIRKQADAGTGIVARCGQGNRYAIDAKDAKRIVQAFKASRTNPSAHAPRTFDALSVQDARHVAGVLTSALTNA